MIVSIFFSALIDFNGFNLIYSELLFLLYLVLLSYIVKKKSLSVYDNSFNIVRGTLFSIVVAVVLAFLE